MKRPSLFPVLLAAFLPIAVHAQTDRQQAVEAAIVEAQAAIDPANPYDNVLFPPNTKLISLAVENNTVDALFNVHLIYRQWTPADRDALHAEIRRVLELDDTAKVNIGVRYGNAADSPVYSLEDHILSRAALLQREKAGNPLPLLSHPVVEHVDYKGPDRRLGLANRNVVVGASHGWTWHKENRWQFQRARLHTIIEDMYPMSYINPFLAPMLENAGATVFSVRERDFQTAEVIVDNDEGGGFRTTGNWQRIDGGGWRGGRPAMLDGRTEPFTLGSTLSATSTADATAVYTPEIPRDGQFAVYLSWKQSENNSPSVPVEINHLGGTTTVRVNQQVAGGTWILVGFYNFAKGINEEAGSVVVSTKTAARGKSGETTISVDAVRFGGGMGNVATGNQISGKPRYAEGARYFLQYAGAPISLLNAATDVGHFGVDYNRDITARSEWANYLQGGDSGPNTGSRSGLGVPVELYLGWHTDAGIKEDGIFGTLGLYRVVGDNNQPNFPDGRSRWLNRDLTSMIHDEIVRSSRELYTSSWARREIRDQSFGEARRPNVPSTILESLSHQNFNDMKYGLDPRYRFDVSRAVYKAIVRFVAMRNDYEPIIQPLPPTHLVARHVQSGIVELAWHAQEDVLEPSASPDGYIIYTSTDGRSFDNGVYTTNTRYRTTEPVEENRNYYYRVTAANGGGESFPTGIVGVRWSGGIQPALIVDGFERISGPAIIEGGATRGFDRNVDPGVGYHYNYALVGNMYDFNPKSEWMNDLETPGWGASNNLWENLLERGNTFDHIVAHGEAFAALNQPFDSASLAGFQSEMTSLNYWMIDWIAGRQRTVMPQEGMQNQGAPDRMKPAFAIMNDATAERLATFASRGGRLFFSGAHIAEELTESPSATRVTRNLASRTLNIRSFKPFSTTTNHVQPAPVETVFDELQSFRFGHDLHMSINQEPTVYGVPSAESYTARSRDDRGMLMYGDSGLLAGIATERAVTLGFPLETVLPRESRTELLRAVMAHFGKDIPKEEEAKPE